MVHKVALITLSFFLFLCLAIASSLEQCPLDLNASVSPYSNITWAQVTNQPILSFGGPSYLRPDIGGALLPWIYTIIVLLVHIPVVIIRVVKWQTVQIWCLVATVFTIAITAQAYISTDFSPEKILTWTPLVLVIDAGSMAQVLFLIIEQYSLLTRLCEALTLRRRHSVEDNLLHEHGIGQSGSLEDGVAIVLGSVNDNASDTSLPRNTELPPLFTSQPLYIALMALALLLGVLLLQIFGLVHAVGTAKATEPSVSWCSPIFQPLGVAVLDGNCNVWPVEQTFAKGVGCILIPGSQQKAWLKVTVAGTSIAIILQVLDIVVLASVHSSTRWRGVKMRRPWFTMFSGPAVLGLMLVFGIVYSTTLPPHISEKVWVVADTGSVMVNEGKLGTAGRRGAMIGWNDGVFEAWGTTYFGSWAA